MAGRPKDSDRTKAEILAAARDLFAERDIRSVTVREIAARAGVAHSLVNRYFGSKDQMLAEILRHEAASYGAPPDSAEVAPETGLASLRQVLLHSLMEARTTHVLLMRAELLGLEPENMLEPEERPLRLMSDWIAQQQAAGGGARRPGQDPAIAAAVVGAAVLAFSNMSPWLMTAVGLKPEDYEARQGEIADALVNFVACAAGCALR